MYPECVIVSWDAFVFLLDTRNIEQRVQLDAEKKSNVYANYKRQEKHANGIFHKEIEHSISHYGEMIKFLKFQGKLLFSYFCSPMTFVV